MILIADSGSTKTSWALVDQGGMVFEYTTLGINPFFQTCEEIHEDLNENLFPKIKQINVDEIFFYGAGCATPEKKEVVATVLRAFHPQAIINVESDLLGVARSLCKATPGIACILGTGSNSCFYDGEMITQNISPLGYILGDEGSGAVLGKLFVADCLKNQMPARIVERFYKRFDLTPAIIMDKVYRQPFPNRFLATLSIFLSENISEPEIESLIYKGFIDFFNRNVKQYDYENYSVNVVGSVGYYFLEILKDAAEETGITIGTVERSPMAGLIEYHTKK
ncbi:MAG: ATPase [Phocaeicola sp.]